MTAGGGGGAAGLGPGVVIGPWALAEPPPPCVQHPRTTPEAGSDGGASVAMGWPGYGAVGARLERWVGCGGGGNGCRRTDVSGK